MPRPGDLRAEPEVGEDDRVGVLAQAVQVAASDPALQSDEKPFSFRFFNAQDELHMLYD